MNSGRARSAEIPKAKLERFRAGLLRSGTTEGRFLVAVVDAYLRDPGALGGVVHAVNGRGAPLDEDTQPATEAADAAS